MDMREALRTVNEFDVTIGSEQLSVCGSPKDGWMVLVNERVWAERQYRYNSDELMFALINFSLADVGEA